MTVEDCFFAGFATALEVHSIGGKTTTLRQSMIVPAAGRPSAPVSPDTPAWGLRMEFMSGGPAGSARKLILEQCTFAGSGFLQLAGFSSEYPLRVEPTGCAVQAEALVAWEPARRETPLDRRSVRWTGRGNHLDITTPSWIVMSAAMTPALTKEVTDLESWSKIADEREPIVGHINFLTSPASRPAVPQPGDFAIDGADPPKAGTTPLTWGRGKEQGHRGPLGKRRVAGSDACASHGRGYGSMHPPRPFFPSGVKHDDSNGEPLGCDSDPGISPHGQGPRCGDATARPRLA